MSCATTSTRPATLRPHLLVILGALLLALCAPAQSAFAEPDSSAGEAVFSVDYAFDSITAPQGTAFEDLGLPATVDVQVGPSDATAPARQDTAAVTWTGDYDPATPGIYTLTMAFADPNLQMAPSVPTWLYDYSLCVDVADTEPFFGDAPTVSMPITKSLSYEYHNFGTYSFTPEGFSTGVYFELKPTSTHTHVFHLYDGPADSVYAWKDAFEYTLYDSHGTKIDSITGLSHDGDGWNAKLKAGLTYYLHVRCLIPETAAQGFSIRVACVSDEHHDFLTDEELAQAYPDIAAQAPTTPLDCLEASTRTQVCRECYEAITTYDDANVGHAYGSDGICTKCGHEQGTDDIVLGQERKVYLEESSGGATLQFTPTCTHHYMIVPKSPGITHYHSDGLPLQVTEVVPDGEDVVIERAAYKYSNSETLSYYLLEEGKTYNIGITCALSSYYSSYRYNAKQVCNATIKITEPRNDDGTLRDFGLHNHAADAAPISVTPAIDCLHPGAATYACDVCGVTSTETLTVPHHFVNGVCTVCGLSEELQTLAMGETASVQLLPNAGVPTYVKFTPEYTHMYRFTCEQSSGIKVAFYDEDWNEVTGVVNQPLNWRAFIISTLEAGKTYYIALSPTSASTGKTATVIPTYENQWDGPHVYTDKVVYTKEPTCSSEGKGTFTCDLCGRQKTLTVDRLPHIYGPDHMCTVCGSELVWSCRNSSGSPAEVWLDDGSGSPKLVSPEGYSAFDTVRTQRIPSDPVDAPHTEHCDNLKNLFYSVCGEGANDGHVWRERTNAHYVISYLSDEYAPLDFTLEYVPETAEPRITMTEGSRGKAEIINRATLDPETGMFDMTDSYGHALFDIKLTFEKADPADKPAQLETVDTNQYGFTINLYDYNAGTDDTASNTPFERTHSSSRDPLPSKGMNAYSPLKFYGAPYVDPRPAPAGDFGASQIDSNRSAPLGYALQGIVLPELGDDGYPVTTEYANQSLTRLFDGSSIEGAKTSYLGVNHLFLQRDDGLIGFDSDTSYAYYNPSQGSAGDFVVYDGTYEIAKHSLAETIGTAASQTVGFMPFDDYNALRTSDMRYVDAIAIGLESYNRHNGFSMTGSFTLPASMKTDDGDNFVFEFGGDDDAWLFIDGVLVAEVAGMHENDEVVVDFTTGEITTSPVTDMEPDYMFNHTDVTVPTTLGSGYTLADAFANAGKQWNPAAEHEFVFYRLNRVSSTPRFSLATNLHEATDAGNATVNVPVAKEWLDGAAAHASDTVTVQLFADGAAVSGATLELSAANKWQSAFTGLPRYKADGTTEIVYSVREQQMPGWHATYEEGGQMVRTRTYWVPVDTKELVSGKTYAAVATSDIGSYLLTPSGTNSRVIGGMVMVHHDAREIAGSVRESYLTSVEDNQLWTLTKQNSGWHMTNQGQYLTLYGATSSYGSVDSRFYEFRTFNLNGWQPDSGGNFANNISIEPLEDGSAIVSVMMNWGSFLSPKEHLCLGPTFFGNISTATPFSEYCTPVTFYEPVTVDEPYEPAGMWTISNSNRVGDLAVRVETAGKGAGSVSALVTVTLDDDTITGTYGDLEFAGGVASITLASGQSLTVRDLPEGVGYRVVGTGVAGYQGPEAQSGTVVAGQATEAKLAYVFGDTPAEAVENLIDDLPEPGDVRPEDQEAIEDARDAYDKLSDEEKAKVPAEDVAKLEEAEKALDKVLSSPIIERIWGDYANETSAKISAASFKKSDWVVIARDDDFADALGAVGLAGAVDAPIVLTDRFELSPAAAAEVKRLGAKHAYIIGGTGAIKEQVDAGLTALGVSVEPRVWGDASYDTSLACAKEIEKVTHKPAETVVIAMSLNFQDALSISPYAYKYKVPVVLQTWGDTSADRGFTDEAAQWLTGKSVLVAGGAGAISEASVAPYTQVDRLWGESGYDTSNKIAEWMTSKGYLGTESIVFACGAQAPKGTDALAGAALAGRLSAPILLASTNEAMESADLTCVNGFYASNASKVRHTFVLGGAYVMPDALYQQIQGMNNALDVSK